MTQLQVVTRVQCPRCRGVGVVENAIWRRFWSAHPGHIIASDVGAGAKAWFEAEGYTISANGYGYPPEEEACSECLSPSGAYGWVYRTDWVPLPEWVKLPEVKP